MLSRNRLAKGLIVGVSILALLVVIAWNFDEDPDPAEVGERPLAEREEVAIVDSEPDEEAYKINEVPFLDFSTCEELIPGEEHGHVLKSWKVQIEPHPSRWGNRAEHVSEGNDLVRFRTPEGTVFDLRFRHFESYGSVRGAYTGVVEGEAFSNVAFSFVNEAVFGVVRLPGKGVAWGVRGDGFRGQVLELVDLDAMGVCQVCSEGN